MQTGWPIPGLSPQYGCISGKMNENKAFVSWSGGKDSSLACLRALTAGCEVSYLLNMLDESGERERAHGIPLIQVNASWGYEPEFKAAVRRLKREGIERGVFGDIDLREHRTWVERVCEELVIVPLLPLWGIDPDALLHEFVTAGFEAIVVATRVNKDWLGRTIDESFISELQECEFHAAGESGEYHSFVINGPLFKRRIRVSETERVRHGDHWFLDIKRGELE
ncbi:MAG TPA: diphthine--ammonia ligase [Methanomicrobia archaeon]|nr:diphthine--ammonia ligase [Methanomicrobia archaeon]